MQSAIPRPLPFIPDNGEMARLIIAHDWLQTPLGDPEDWPQSLKTTLSILLHSKFPTVLFWGSELVCFYNDAFRPSLGVEGKHPWSLGKRGEEMWTEIWPVIHPWLNQVLTGGESIWMENQLVPFYRDGKVDDIYWTFCYSAVFDESNTPAGVFVTCTETTEIISSDKRLKESEWFAHNILQQSEIAQSVWSVPDLVYRIVNDKMLSFLDRDSSVIGLPVTEVIQGERLKVLQHRIQQLIRTGETYMHHEEYIPQFRAGKWVDAWYHYSLNAIRNKGEGITHILCTLIDVTEQVRSRKKVEEGEANFKNLVLQAPVGICIVEKEDKVIELVNPLFLQLVGRSYEQMIHQPYWEVLKEAAPTYAPILQNVFDTGTSYSGNEHRLQLIRNGKEEEVFISFVYEPIRMEGEPIRKVMILGIDVTPQVLSRKQIEEAQLREKLAIDVSQLGVFEVDLLNNVVFASPRLEEIFEVAHTTERERFVKSIHPDDLPIREEAYKIAYKTGLLRYDCRVLRKDGTVNYVRSWGNITFNEEGSPVKLFGVTQDVTEEKRFEEMLNHMVMERTAELQEKNAELERSNQRLEDFAHAASHDLKEPIRKIHFYTDRLKKQLSANLSEEEISTFQRIETSSKRMIALIDDLLYYSHISQLPFEKEWVDLNKKLELVMDDLELEVHRKKAEIIIDHLPKVLGYRRQLQQLFQNLVSNALKYSSKDRKPVIRVRAMQVKAGDFAQILHDEDRDKRFHLIEVEDNGIGFEPQESEKIFKVFHRLHDKSAYSGTGIGLSIALKVAENHDGKLTAEGRPGEGAVFRVFLHVEEVTM